MQSCDVLCIDVLWFSLPDSPLCRARHYGHHAVVVGVPGDRAGLCQLRNVVINVPCGVKPQKLVMFDNNIPQGGSCLIHLYNKKHVASQETVGSINKEYEDCQGFQIILAAAIRLCRWTICLAEMSGCSRPGPKENMYTWHMSISRYFKYSKWPSWKFSNTSITLSIHHTFAHSISGKTKSKMFPQVLTRARVSVDFGRNSGLRSMDQAESMSLNSQWWDPKSPPTTPLLLCM